MKLKRYLQEDKDEELNVHTNYRLLDEDECIDLIKSSYDVAFNSRKHIYRGVNNDANYMYVNPKLVTRRSANTANYYTELLDSFESWKDYPKRSKSLICSTSYYTANGYGRGNCYIVLPKNNTKLAVCPRDDLWWSFSKLKTIEPVVNLDMLNNALEYTIKTLFKYKKIRDKNIIHECKRIDKSYLIKYNDKKLKEIDKYNLLTSLINSNYDNLYDYLNYMMDPKLNKFKLISLEKFDNSSYLDREVWTDAESLMINYRMIKYNAFDVIKDRLNNETKTIH